MERTLADDKEILLHKINSTSCKEISVDLGSLHSLLSSNLEAILNRTEAVKYWSSIIVLNTTFTAGRMNVSNYM